MFLIRAVNSSLGLPQNSRGVFVCSVHLVSTLFTEGFSTYVPAVKSYRKSSSRSFQERLRGAVCPQCWGSAQTLNGSIGKN